MARAGSGPRRVRAGTRPASLGGRPSRAESEKLGERILDAATSLFLAHGYGATSIEQVARKTRISKRTFYHRFEDKPTLFGAVVNRIVETGTHASLVALGGIYSSLAALQFHAAGVTR